MIISKKYAQKLVREGKASLDGHTKSAITWRVVNRLDIQRVDHYPVMERVEVPIGRTAKSTGPRTRHEDGIDR